MKGKRIVVFLLVMSMFASMINITVLAANNTDIQEVISKDAMESSIIEEPESTGDNEQVEIADKQSNDGENLNGNDSTMMESKEETAIKEENISDKISNSTYGANLSAIKLKSISELKDENISIQKQLEEETRKNVEAYNKVISESKSKIKSFSATNINRYQLAIANSNGTFTYQNISYANFSDAKVAMDGNKNTNMVVLDGSRVIGNQVVAMKDGVVVITADKVGKVTLTFKFPNSNADTYVNNGNDAFYYDSTGTTVKIGISGQVGAMLDINQVELIPRVQITAQSYYGKNSNGDLYHCVAEYKYNANTNRYTGSYGSFTISKAPSFMKTNTKYYSINGTDFYTDTKLNTLTGTYYPYFKYLSFRSKTSYTAEELNAFISSWNKSDSVLNGKGEVFIKAQNDFGVNAALLLSSAIHESAYGTSSLAKGKNNIFGINAVDENPYGRADKFNSVEDCIYYQAQYYISRKYLDATSNTDYRYFGANVGNKNQGLNVKYASDPYWGEKIAGHMYRLDNYLGRKDNNKYQIAISNKITNARNATSSDASIYYRYAARNGRTQYNLPIGMPILITGDLNSWYEVQSDMGIDSKKTTPTSFATIYNFELSKAYVSVSDFDLINEPQTLYIDPALEGKNNIDVSFNTQGGNNIGNIKTEYNSTIAPPSDPVRNGYIFRGWYKEANCSNPWDFVNDRVMKDTVLYAKWNTKQKFTDIPPSNWAYDYIDSLANQNIINGYEDDSFKPNNALTRAQAVVMIINAAGINYEGKVSNFIDVPSTNWASAHIAAAKDAGILNGYGDRFKPNENITRAQIAAIISNAFNLENTGKHIDFKDVPNTHWANKHIKILASHDIISGYEDGTYKPNELTTRAQFSKILYTAMSK